VSMIKLRICRKKLFYSRFSSIVREFGGQSYLVRVPIDTTSSIWIRVDQGDALEASGGLQSRNANRVTYELGVVELDERSADGVGARGEIDQSRSGRRRVAALTASRASSNCCIDCRGIIGASISSSAKVLHISEYLISSSTKSSRALSGDRCEPVARGGGIVRSGDRDRSRSGSARDEEEQA
jgi:hypothetical protein